jgi:hypothetical protein
MANAVKRVFVQFTKVWSIHCGFYKWKIKDYNLKMFISQLEIDNEVFIGICQSLYEENQQHSRSAVRFTTQLAISCLIAY